jgi:hypothetical protein
MFPPGERQQHASAVLPVRVPAGVRPFGRVIAANRLGSPEATISANDAFGIVIVPGSDTILVAY